MPVIARLIAGASFLLAATAGLGVFLTMFVICADVTLRFFGSSVPGTIAFVSNYLMVVVAFLPLAKVERDDATITVDVVTAPLGSHGRRFIAFTAAAISFVIYCALAYATWGEAMGRYAAGAYAITIGFTLTTWPAYFLIPISMALAAALVALKMLEALTGQAMVSADGQLFGPHHGPDDPDAGARI